MSKGILRDKAAWVKWLESSKKEDLGKERPAFSLNRNVVNRGFLLLASLWACGWEMDVKETKKVDWRVVLKKNGCKIVIDSDVVEFSAPYLKRPIYEYIFNLTGLYMIRNELPLFGQDTLDLVNPQNGLSPAYLAGYDRELRAMLKQLNSFISARKRYPGSEELVRWCAATSKHTGLRAKWGYLFALLRRGDGKTWIRIKLKVGEKGGSPKTLVVPLHRKALPPDVESELMKQQMAPRHGRRLW